MKFGDLIENEYTPKRSPHHILMVLSVSGGFINCVAFGGSMVKFRIRDNKEKAFLRIVGSADFEEWKIALAC